MWIKNREVMREFFGVLKGGNVNKALKFVFLSHLYDHMVDIRDSSLKVQYKKLHLYLRQEQFDLFIEKHLHGGRKILLLGINFSTNERRIADWRVEVV